MTIKLNEFDKKLLSQITPASKWDKLKSIYAINSIVKQLKIGNKKIGTKCAKHLQKLSKQDSTNINEIREGCIDLRIKKKQTLPLAKDKTKRPVESTHKINKATDKAPTDKTKGGGGRGGRGGGGGGGGGAPQPQADLIGGLFNAFKAQQAKQARDTQFNQLEAERRQNIVNQQIPQGAAGDALRERMQGPAAQTYLDALRETSSITGLTEGERLLYQQLLYDRDIAQQAQLYNVSGDYSMKSDSVNLLNQLENKIYRAREQDLSGFTIPPTPRSVFTASSQISDDTLTPRTISTDSGSGVGLFAPLGVTPQTSLQSEVKKKSFESEKLRSINNSFKKINDLRTRIQQEVKEGKMSPAQASEGLEKLLQLETTDIAMRGARETLKMQTDIIDDIERYGQMTSRNRKAGVDSVLSRLRNRESQEKQDRLVNDLITNQNEKKMKDIQSELLGAVSNRLEANERQQLQTTQNLKNEIMGNIKQRGKKMQNVDEKFILEKQELQKTINIIEEQQEQERADRAIREFVSRQNLSEFNQQSQPLGLTRTSSLSLLERMEADSLRQAKENQDLQRTLSAGDTPSQDLDLDVERAERKIREEQESEAIFNRKQQELAQEIKNLKTEPPLMAFGEEENITALPIQKKESPREKSLKEMIAERQSLQDTLARIDAIEPMEDTMLEDIEKATKEVEEEEKLDLPLFGISKPGATAQLSDKELFEKVRKVKDYKLLPTDTDNQIDNYINYSVNKYNEYRVNRPLYIEKGVPEDIEKNMNLTFALKAYQAKKLGKEDLMLKELESTGNFDITAHPDLVADMSENYYDVYARELEELADRNAIFED